MSVFEGDISFKSHLPHKKGLSWSWGPFYAEGTLDPGPRSPRSKLLVGRFGGKKVHRTFFCIRLTPSSAHLLSNVIWVYQVAFFLILCGFVNPQPFYQRLSEVVGKCLFSAESGANRGQVRGRKKPVLSGKTEGTGSFLFQSIPFYEGWERFGEEVTDMLWRIARLRRWMRLRLRCEK